MLEIMRDEKRCMGRLYFTSFLEYIREGQKSSDRTGGFERIEDKVRNWQTSGASKHLEQQLLLKELCIGRRVEELPSWSGVLSDGQLIEHLKGHFTESIAAKFCSKVGTDKTKDLVEFSESDINGLGLADPHRKILLKLVNQAEINRIAPLRYFKGHFTFKSINDKDGAADLPSCNVPRWLQELMSKDEITVLSEAMHQNQVHESDLEFIDNDTLKKVGIVKDLSRAKILSRIRSMFKQEKE